MSLPDRLAEIEAEPTLVRAAALLAGEATPAAAIVKRAADADTPERFDELLAQFDVIRAMIVAVKSKL